MLLAIALWSLRGAVRAGFEGGSALDDLLGRAVLLSAIVAVWMVIVGRRQHVFYQYISRAVRGQRAQHRGIFGRMRNPIEWRVALAVLLWTGLPLLLHVLGFNLLSQTEGHSARLMLFGAYVVAPQALLTLMILGSILPVRRFAYRGPMA